MKFVNHSLASLVDSSRASIKSLDFRLAIRIAYIVIFMCGGAFGEDKLPERQSREVRKAIPLAQPLRDGGSQRLGSESARNSQAGGGASDAVTNGIVSGGASRSLSIGADDLEAKSPTAPNTMKALNDKRRIGMRDKLSLSIVEDELPQRQIVVTDSGEIDVPYIGRVAVEGRTCKELATLLKNLLEKEYYYQATVLIGLDSAGGQVMSKGRFYIDGQVNRAGPYEIPVDEVLTISKAIIRAGGFTQYANRKKVRLMRKNSAKSEMEIYVADMIEVMEKGKTRNDIEIMPDDRIFVDEKFFNF
jgi:protein involved in polysaccharide export with SLBB domain